LWFCNYNNDNYDYCIYEKSSAIEEFNSMKYGKVTTDEVSSEADVMVYLSGWYTVSGSATINSKLIE